MEVEKWKDISDYPGYQVSSLGRVKSIRRTVKSKNGYRIVKEKILKPNKIKVGYLRVDLCKDGKKKHMLVHRLVADAFVQNESLFYNEINHLDENKENNCASNLEWSDRQHNINFGTRNERVSKVNTNNPKRSKKVICIETGVVYPSLSDVHRKFGFSKGNISYCCAGKLNSAYGYHWRYVE